MANIFEKLGLAEDAGVEEIAKAQFCADCNNRVRCYEIVCDMCDEYRDTVALLTALAAREREDVWGKMCKHCHQSYCQNRNCKALDWDKPDYATCPLLGDEKGGESNEGL